MIHGRLYGWRSDCRLCGGVLDEVARLAPQSFLTPDTAPHPDLGRREDLARLAAPMTLCLCRNCGGVQQACVFSPLLRDPNGVFPRATPLKVRAYFADLAAELARRLGPRGMAVDLSSFDGALCSALEMQGFTPLGVEPLHATVAAEHPCEPSFFTAGVAEELRRRYGPARLITAVTMSVGPHWCHPANVDDLDDYAEGIHALLADDGMFLLETQYAVDTVQSRLMDTIHHDHVTYFTFTPLTIWLSRHGLVAVDVARLPAKGGSLRVFVQRRETCQPSRPSVAALLSEEARLGAGTAAFWRMFSQTMNGLRERLHGWLDAHPGPAIGFGVSVGTAALLAQFELADRIDFLTDDAPGKGDRFVGPGFDLPVRPSASLYDAPPGVAILFAWRFADAIIKRHEAYRRSGGIFLAPLPELREL